jgi:hypothetical protein
MFAKQSKSKYNYALYSKIVMPETTDHHKIKPKDIFMGIETKKPTKNKNVKTKKKKK